MSNGSWELTDLYPGAHIRVRTGSFYHHGIYIGGGEVVQFGLPRDIYGDPSEIRILRSPVKDFCPDDSSFIEVYRFSRKELKQKQSDAQIVAAALAHVGEGGYSVLRNNCEHFANFCVFGRKTSAQIDDVCKNVSEMLKSAKGK
ncbi:MAG: lecithin retinol acyltransferase family protein [Clostridia bacterium]|nr:lecithin retinol acyltransferase family protein [Clostridia bacterium]